MMENRELPEGWEKTKLSEVSELIFGQSPPSSTYNLEGKGWPFFQGKAEFGAVYPLPRVWCTEPTRIVQAGDILISVRAPVGPTNLAPSECAIGRGLAAIRPRLIQRGFIQYYLKLIESDLVSKGTGTTFAAITKDVLQNQEVLVAPLNEQQRIVSKIDELFSDLDQGEANLRHTQKLLATYRKSVLKTAMTGELINVDGGAWEESKLGQLITDIRYGTAKKCAYDPSKTPVLRIPNVVTGKINLSDLKHTDFTEAEIRNLRLKKGDVLLVRSNGSASLVARSAIIGDEAENFAYAGYLIRLRLKQEKILPEFLHLFLQSPGTRRIIESQARSTSGVHNINSDEIKKLVLRLPSIDEQLQIIDRVDGIFSQIDALEAWCKTELARSTTLRQAILKAAFSGQLVPQDPTDEPASELLKRIRAKREEQPANKPQRNGHYTQTQLPEIA